MTLFFVLVLMALQLTVIAMLQHIYANKNVKKMGDLLHAQSERIAVELQAAIKEGTQAAHLAYEEANSVNVKISDLNERLLVEQRKDDP